MWLELQRYPGTLLLYGLGLGAIEADRLKFLGRLFSVPVHRENSEDFPAVQLLPPFCLFADGGQRARILSGMDRRHAPLNDWLHDVLRKPAGRLIPNDNRYTLVFDKREIIMALGFAHHAKRTKDWYWAPPGAFGYRSDNRSQVLQEVEQSISSMGDQSPFVASGIFGDSAKDCTQALTAFREFTAKVSGSWL